MFLRSDNDPFFEIPTGKGGKRPYPVIFPLSALIMEGIPLPESSETSPDSRIKRIPCPAAGCAFGVTYENENEKTLPCERCLTRICLKCGSPYHGLIPCEEFSARIKSMEKGPTNSCYSCRLLSPPTTGDVSECPICQFRACSKCLAPYWSGHHCDLNNYVKLEGTLKSLQKLEPLCVAIIPQNQAKDYLENRLTMLINAMGEPEPYRFSEPRKRRTRAEHHLWLSSTGINPDSLSQYAHATFYASSGARPEEVSNVTVKILILGTMKLLGSLKRMSTTVDFSFSPLMWLTDQWRFHSQELNPIFTAMTSRLVGFTKRKGLPVTVNEVREFVEKEIYSITDHTTMTSLSLAPRAVPAETKAADVNTIQTTTSQRVNKQPTDLASQIPVSKSAWLSSMPTLPPLPFLPMKTTMDDAIDLTANRRSAEMAKIISRIKPDLQSGIRDDIIKQVEQIFKTSVQSLYVAPTLSSPNITAQSLAKTPVKLIEPVAQPVAITSEDELRSAVERSVVSNSGEVATIPIALVQQYASKMVLMLANKPKKRPRSFYDPPKDVKRTKS